MANSTGRRSWDRAQTKGRRIAEDVVVGLFVLLALGLCFCAQSYAVNVRDFRRVGVLFRGFPSPELQHQFRKSLSERGWVEGRNIIIEERYGEGKRGRLLNLAKEFIAIETDVIVVNGAPAARAARIATNTIPIVVIGGNPVADDLVANRLRPDGNVTGVSTSESPEMSGKRLELIWQALSGIERIAVLLRPEIGNHALHFKHTREAAKMLGITVQAVELEQPGGVDDAFSRMIKPQAVLILPWGMDIPYQRKMILQSAAKRRLPTVYTGRNFVTQGGFMSYGPVRTHTWKRAAMLVDKLLKGASPADLPVERPLHFELVINLKTANSFGLTVAPELLLQADEVIR